MLRRKLSKCLTQTFLVSCNVMICHPATLSGEAERPKVAGAVIEAAFSTLKKPAANGACSPKTLAIGVPCMGISSAGASQASGPTS